MIGRTNLWLLLGVLLVAANLRVGLSVVGPLLPTIAEDLDLSGLAQGGLTALPVAAFAVFSLMGTYVAGRIGLYGAIGVSLTLYTAGMAIRSMPTDLHPTAVLLLGTAIMGSGVALANVLLPAIAKLAFSSHIASVTGGYIAVQTIIAATGAALVYPLAVSVGSWRFALGVWVVLVLVTVIAWVRARDEVLALTSADASRTAPLGRSATSIWRSRRAWVVSAYFGLQSTVFFVLLTWLPAIQLELGVSAVAAGANTGVFLIVGIASTIAVPWTLTLRGDQRIALSLVPAIMISALVALWLAPGAAVVWVALCGLCSGYVMPAALSVISLRARPADTTGSLSSMVQSVGYTLVATALVAAALFRDVVDAAAPLVFVVAGVLTLQIVAGLTAGRRGTV